MIISNLSFYKNVASSAKNIRVWKGIEIAIGGGKTAMFRCDTYACQTKFEGVLLTWFDRRFHYCPSCVARRRNISKKLPKRKLLF